MKQIIRIFLLNSLFMGVTFSQNPIRWKLTDIKSDSFHRSVQIIISDFNIGDTIRYKQNFIAVACAGTIVNILDLEVLGDSVLRIIHCKDTQFVKMPIDRKLQFFKTQTQKLNIKILKQAIVRVAPVASPTLVEMGESSGDGINIYHDAFTLFDGDASSRLQILNKYQVDSTNTFLRELRTSTVKELIDLGELQSAGIGDNAKIEFIASGILGLPVTALADGLAKFIVGRVKQELMISFFNGFTRKLNDSSIQDLHKIFKNTHGTLKLIGVDIYNFQNYLASIRQSMELDYKNLANSLTKLTNDDQSQLYNVLNKTNNARFLVATGLTFYNSINEHHHIGSALANIKPVEFSLNTSPQLITAFQSLQLFSESLRDNEGSENYWVNKDQINSLINNKTFLQYLLGLVAQKARMDNIKHSPSRSLYSFLNEDIGTQKIHVFDTLLKSLKSAIAEIEAIRIQEAITESDRELQIANYIDGSLEVLKSIKYFKTIFNFDSMDESNILITITENLSSLIKNISTKKYSIVALNLGNLFKAIGGVHDKSDFSKTLSFITTHAPFIAQLAESKTSDEVKAVLESFAAPIGSWRDKRVTTFNVALDSYLGPTLFFNDGKDKAALSTPVGISFSTSVNGISYSILLSAIDIGPLTAYRFRNDSLGTAKITLQEIVAPGIIISLGFGRKNAIALNFGWQQYSLLTKVSEKENSYNTKKQLGWPLSLHMNIPILTLVNKRK